MTISLLSADGARLTGGGLTLERFEASGPRLVLVGAWAPLFELLSGRRQLAGGVLRVLGEAAEGAAARGLVGLALEDAPLPPTWTLAEVLESSAALAGESRKAATDRARHVLAELHLGGLAQRRLARLTPPERRAAAIAAALVSDPPVLALEAPFSGLEPSGRDFVERLISRAVVGRAALVSVPELPAGPSEDALAQRSSELLFLSEHRLVARGSYRELSSRARSYRVVVARSVDALLARLSEAGYEVRRMLTADVTTLLVVDTRAVGTVPLLRAALAADAPIIELVAGLGGAAGTEA